MIMNEAFVLHLNANVRVEPISVLCIMGSKSEITREKASDLNISYLTRIFLTNYRGKNMTKN